MTRLDRSRSVGFVSGCEGRRPGSGHSEDKRKGLLLVREREGARQLRPVILSSWNTLELRSEMNPLSSPRESLYLVN